jgi:hypothetical protein
VALETCGYRAGKPSESRESDGAGWRGGTLLLVFLGRSRNCQLFTPLSATALEDINSIFHAGAKSVLPEALPLIERAIDVHGRSVICLLEYCTLFEPVDQEKSPVSSDGAQRGEDFDSGISRQPIRLTLRYATWTSSVTRQERCD